MRVVCLAIVTNGQPFKKVRGCVNVKKQTVIGMALIAALGISGCGVTELNEEQNAQAAEYLAGAMLKYTTGYEKSLIYAVATPEPTVSTLSPEQTQAPSPTDKPGDNTMPGKSGDPASNEENNTVLSDLNDVLDIAKCKVAYKSMKECNSYKESENTSIGVFAEDGRKLIVVKFQIKNPSSKDVKIDLHKNDVTYQLVLPDGKVVTSQLTLLGNDMNYLSTTVKKGKKAEGIVVFEVSKKTSVSDAKLKVIGKNTTAEIAL